jgi:hypothetical protein
VHLSSEEQLQQDDYACTNLAQGCHLNKHRI